MGTVELYAGTVARSRQPRRALSLVALGAALTTALTLAPLTPSTASGGMAPTAVKRGKVMSASLRKVAAPNVQYPVPADAVPTDLLTYTDAHHGTEIAAPCGTPVRSVTAGVAHLVPDVSWAGGTVVQIATTPGRLTTWYAYLKDVNVSEGQILSAGQPIGTVGDTGSATQCSLHFQVRSQANTTIVNPTNWLERWVGQPTPDTVVFGNTGFVISSFNALGATHTQRGGDARNYPVYTTRMPRMISYLKSRAIDVAGLQEFQKVQHTKFTKLAGKDWAVYPPHTNVDTDNSIIWKRSKFVFKKGMTVSIPYFNGHPRKMPYVLLREKATNRTFWLLNVHNPADTKQYHHQAKWRAKAVQIEHDLIVSLRADGRPVFFTGDMNDRKDVFCSITAGKLAVAANSIPSMECAPPADMWIDWIFAAGQARFTTYNRDWRTKDLRITDHPALFSQVFLAG